MGTITDGITKNSSELESSPGTAPFPIHRLAFHGSGEDLFDIFIINLLKTIVTFGIYSFWAKVRTRQYLWSQSEFAGDRFGFHGTGRELFIGWFKAAVLFGGLVALTNLLPFLSDEPWLDVVSQLIFLGGFMALIPLAIIGSMRYRLSRTSWRGIRFTFRGRYQPFLRLWVRGLFLTGLSLGLYYPVYRTNTRRFLVEHTFFGSAPFRFNGNGGDLLVRFALTLLLTIPTLGLIWVWYAAHQRRYYWDHTSFAAARFHSTVTAGSLLGLYAVNLALIVISLGLALPWATVRTKRYDLEHLVLRGPVDLNHITQQAQTATPVGEELADLFNMDALPG